MTVPTQPVIIPIDLEDWLIDHLQDLLDARAEPYASGVKVRPTIPNPIPAGRFIQITRTGGGRLNIRDEKPRFSVNVITSNVQEVKNLSALVRALVYSLRFTAPVKDVTEITGPTQVDDPSGRPWRFMSFELLARIEVAQ
jgi:hypothetical protein